MKKTALFFIVFATILAGCTREVAHVGDRSISEQDVAYRSRISAVYDPAGASRPAALARLIRSSLAAELLRALGKPVTRAVLEKEAERIDADTLDAAMLGRIKEVCGRNRTAYLRTFILPLYAERTLYVDAFLRKPEIQAQRRSRAESMLRAWGRSSGTFGGASTQQDVSASLIRVVPDKAVLAVSGSPLAKEWSDRNGRERAERIGLLLVRIRPGMVFPQVVEWPESFQLMKLVKREGAGFLAESIQVAKRPFDDWLLEQAADIPVRIADRALIDGMHKEVSWTQRLRFR